MPAVPLATIPLLNLEVTNQVAFNGLVRGFTYGILAVGLVLIYRSTRVINFAYGEMGALSAALLARLVVNWDLNYFLAFALILVFGALVGGAIDLIVVRRFFTSPRIILFVATLGVSQLLFFIQVTLPDIERFESYPTPFDFRWEWAGMTIRSEHLLVLTIVPILTLALAFFLGRTKYGTAIRASAANADAARLSAIPVKWMSTLVWVIAGSLATVTAVLIAPLQGTSAAQTTALGPSLLLRALAAGLIGRMQSLPLALAGGTAIGITEAVLFFNNPSEPGSIDAILFVVVLVAVLVISYRSRETEEGTWSFAPRVRAIPSQLSRLWWVRNLPRLLGGLALVVAVLLPVVFDQPSKQFLYSHVLVYAIVALSLTLLTGWAGQLSLGQFAFVGLGAMLTASLVNGMRFDLFGTTYLLQPTSYAMAMIISVIASVAVALIVGAPALRVKGLMLAVTTLAFAVMAQSWLFTRPFLLGERSIVLLPRDVAFPSLNFEIFGLNRETRGFLDLTSQQTFYYLVLAALVVTIYLMYRIRASGIGRSMIAVRNNENGAAAFTVSPARMKLMAFGVAGGIAGLAGSLLGGVEGTFSPSVFSPEQSLLVVTVAVIGGLSSIWGAVLGAVFVFGLPAFFPHVEEIRLLTSGVGTLILLMYFPGGLIQLGYKARDSLFEWLAARMPEPEVRKAEAAPIPVHVRRSAEVEPASSGPALETTDITVRFGRRVAVAGVGISVAQHEVVGLIGNNGAGKSTFMNAIGGFVPSTGSVEIFGRSATGLSPARRARLGLGRAFQSASLFTDLTVAETVQVALEARHRASLPSTLLSLPRSFRSERAKRAEADELVAFFGLGRYRDRFIDELSTGTRRIVELACLLALDARLLCLDEPTAGVAQRETEAFAPLILRIRQELGASMLVIEHDMPFIMSISDRVYCLEAGALIAEGDPETVRRDPAVIASYLGTDERAIERSDAK